MSIDSNSPDTRPQDPEIVKPKPRILILSQTNGFDEALKEKFLDMPFDSDIGWRPEDVISLMQRREFDLLVTDKTEGLYRINKHKKHPRIILVSGDMDLIQSLSSENSEGNEKRRRYGIEAVLDIFADDFPSQFKAILVAKNK